MASSYPGGATVLMSVYHKDDVRLFERAVESIYHNSLLPDDFLLVVDGPVPDTLDACIRRLQARRGFRVLRLPENQGLAVALNRGIQEITTEWILRADADDFNVAERFQLQADAILSDPNLDLVGGNILELEGALPIAMRRVPGLHEEIRRFSRLRSPFNHMTVAYRRSRVVKVGGYPDIFLKEDYGLWAALLGDGCRCLNLEEVLVHASAGRDMYHRRGGARYAVAEIQLQTHLLRCGLKGRFEAIMHGLLRSAVFLLPGRLRGLLYERALRARVGDRKGSSSTSR